MLETIICIAIFGFGAIIGIAVAVAYDASNNSDDYNSCSETELQWKLMVDENRRLLKESMEH